MGLDRKQWLSLVFWHYSDFIQMWAVWDSQWMKFADLDEPKLGHWHHVCLEVSPAKGELSASMNGLDMGSVSEKSVVNVPTKLELLVGKWTNVYRGEEEQFHGLVTNIQVFASGQDIKELSMNPCSNKGDLLSWNANQWVISGQSWTLSERREEDVQNSQGEHGSQDEETDVS